MQEPQGGLLQGPNTHGDRRSPEHDGGGEKLWHYKLLAKKTKNLAIFAAQKMTPWYENPATLLPPREPIFWPAFVARIRTPRSRKSGYMGFFWGVDQHYRWGAF